MSRVIASLDCGCAIMADGRRAVCPSCSAEGTRVTPIKGTIDQMLLVSEREATQEVFRLARELVQWFRNAPIDPDHGPYVVCDELAAALNQAGAR